MASSWLAYEVERALNKEREGTTAVFYAIRLDDAVLKAKAAWADDIRRTGHIIDFTSWTEPAEYHKALSQLLQDLKEKKERGEGSKLAADDAMRTHDFQKRASQLHGNFGKEKASSSYGRIVLGGRQRAFCS